MGARDDRRAHDLQPLIERQSQEFVAEVDEAFLRDIEERGIGTASGPVGPGGMAALTVQPETPRGGEADKLPDEPAAAAAAEPEPAAG